MSIDADRPINCKDQDRFHRHPFAAQIARLAISLPRQESFVLGVTGAWGSGKTSVLQMVEAELFGRTDILVLHFNPWLFSGAQDLVADFFREIAAQVAERPGASPAASRLGEKLTMLGKYLSPVGKVAGAIATATGYAVAGPLGVAGVEAAAALAGVEGERRRAAAAAPTSLRAQRKQIEEDLLVADFKLLVMIDDIDRLHDTEIREIMRLVRLTADFPNMIYLLAFDRDRVEAALGETKEAGRVYLEKIFQATYDLPSISRSDLSAHLQNEVNALLAVRPHILSEKDHLQNVFFQCVAPLFFQPREIKRYVNSLAFALESLGNEVTVADILGMEALRTQVPAAFSLLSGASAALVETGQDATSLVEPLLKAAGDLRKPVTELLNRMFPLFQRYTTKMNYGEQWTRGWRKERRVAHREVFDLYFLRTVPSGGITAPLVSRVISALTDEARLKETLAAVDTGQLPALLDRMEDYQHEYPKEAAEVAVPILLNNGARLQRTPGSIFGPEMAVDRVVLRLLRRVDDETERTSAVTAILPRVTSLSARLRLVRLCKKERGHGLVTAQGEVTLEAQLRREVLAATVQQLVDEADLAQLLDWASAGSFEERERIRQIAEHHDLFIRLLQSTVGYATSQAMGSVVVRTDAFLPWAAHERFLGTERLHRLVREVAALQDDPACSESAREAIKLAVKYAGGWRPDPLWDNSAGEQDRSPAASPAEAQPTAGSTPPSGTPAPSGAIPAHENSSSQSSPGEVASTAAAGPEAVSKE